MKLLEYALLSTIISIIVGITLLLNDLYDPSIPIVFWWFISFITCISLLFIGEIFYEDYQTPMRPDKFQDLHEMLMEGDD